MEEKPNSGRKPLVKEDIKPSVISNNIKDTLEFQRVKKTVFPKK